MLSNFLLPLLESAANLYRVIYYRDLLRVWSQSPITAVSIQQLHVHARLRQVNRIIVVGKKMATELHRKIQKITRLE